MALEAVALFLLTAFLLSLPTLIILDFCCPWFAAGVWYSMA
jgi:hypothetical protein